MYSELLEEFFSLSLVRFDAVDQDALDLALDLGADVDQVCPFLRTQPILKDVDVVATRGFVTDKPSHPVVEKKLVTEHFFLILL